VLRQISNDKLSADFHAQYSKFLRVCYSVELRIKKSSDLLHLSGDADLGALAGGIYRYDGDSPKTISFAITVAGMTAADLICIQLTCTKDIR
jgi:hypothetical protein